MARCEEQSYKPVSPNRKLSLLEAVHEAGVQAVQGFDPKNSGQEVVGFEAVIVNGKIVTDLILQKTRRVR